MQSSSNLSSGSPLPITLAAGMGVVRQEDNPIGRVAGVTSSYCVYTLGDTVWVDRWRDLAVAGVCPAQPLLPDSVVVNDRLDANARLLRELVLLGSLGQLTTAQRDAMNELTDVLCPSVSASAS